VISRIPANWDDTRVFAGDVGKLAVIARRSGKDWWVGAMGGRDAVNTEVPLKFLGPGKLTAEMIRNDPNSPGRIGTDTTVVSDADTLLLRLGPADGAVVHLTPVEGK